VCSSAGGNTGHLDGPQHVYNLAAAVGWGIYLPARAIRTPSVPAAWGFRRSGVGLCSALCLPVLAIGVCLLLACGMATGRLPLPRTFWSALVLYPVWGLAQQFALQALITRNLRPILPVRWWRAAAAAGLFSLAHFPRFALMGLTFPLGIVLALIYERTRNLWPLGVTHGVLGSMAYYLVLGQDLGAELIRIAP
jgi:membrane protease YdiL (CAAX protease family)